ncbi:MAG: DUF3429 domain-containing protein [Mangrovicoccus sp.]|nr:DUF3429 domain-containing protein [Mangrovicoccus sp.]
MSRAIPQAALALGLAGVLPFAWGALTAVLPMLADLAAGVVGARFTGLAVQVAYGTVILAFMSGVLWGFATQAEPAEAGRAYGLSTLPALFVFFFAHGSPERAALVLVAGFLGLLALDLAFVRAGLAPPWWMPLRVLLTALVTLCLVIGLAA